MTMQAAEFRGAACDFERDYEVAQAPLMREIERLVRGSDFGATSWTTRAQAEQTMARLGLAPGMRLLEIGAGAGWPALFLAGQSGCHVVLTDLPLSGLRIARSRAVSDGIAQRVGIAAADGAVLPFADHAFDRIHHADVLCCMDRKFEMLRECRRVARPAAWMEFSVIWLARRPTDQEEIDLLQQSGPPYPDAGGDYGAMLTHAGWRVLERIEVTGEFVRCMDMTVAEMRARRDGLAGLLGAKDYRDRIQRRESTLAAVSRGLLKREIFVCRPWCG
jgi:cyclopropane fatty-acyl-phospholipid synthase-like methyltransferase